MHSQKWHRIHKHHLENQKKNKKKRLPQKTTRKPTKNGDKKIHAPEILSLYTSKNSEKVLKKFNIKNVLDETKNIVIDFSSTELITLSGGIFLYGFFKTMKYRNIVVNLKYSKSEKIKYILQYLEQQREKEDTKYEDIKCWKMFEFNKRMSNREEIVEHMKKDLELKGKEMRIADSAIVEILSNCVTHAYPHEDDFQMFYLFLGTVPKEDIHAKEQYTFCIFDHGVGFKKSYIRNNPKQKTNIWRTLHGGLGKEGKIINHIITQQVSGTREENRGKGLSKLQAMLLQKDINGSLMIYSHKGFWESGENNKPPITESRKKIHGTLVQFSIPLN